MSHYCRILLRDKSHCSCESVTKGDSSKMPAIPGENLLTTLYVYGLCLS